MIDQVYSIIERGGPIMWPLLLTSIISFTVSIERIIFLFRFKSAVSQSHEQRFSELLANKKLNEALGISEISSDPLLKVIGNSNLSSLSSFQISFHRDSLRLLNSIKKGLGILDTSITIAPLLGLLGTVTGLIQSFYSLGNAELSSPIAITGGISEALIATGFGLGVAIFCLIPFNLLTSTEESTRESLEQLGTMFEIAMSSNNNNSNS